MRIRERRLAIQIVAISGAVLAGAVWMFAQSSVNPLGQRPPLLPGGPAPTLPGQPAAVPEPTSSTSKATPSNEPKAPDFVQANIENEAEAPTFRVDTIQIQVPVIVTDRDNNFINNLQPPDFQLFDEGIPRTFQFDVTAHPISMVVAVQADVTAGAMLPSVNKVASMFNSLIVGETGEMAVIAFDHRIQEMTNGFTSDQDDIKAAFTKIKPGGRSHKLDDAAMHAVNMLRSRPKDRKRILMLISETRDSGSKFSPRDVLTNAEFNDVIIYAIDMNHLLNQLTAPVQPNRPNAIPPEARSVGMPMGIIRTGTTDAQLDMGNWTPIFKEIFALVKGVFVPNSLEVYTKFTGGSEMNFVSLGGLEESIGRIGNEIHSEYLLTYSPGASAEGGYHEIEVRVLKPQLKVRSRPGYWIAPRAATPADDKAGAKN